MLGNATEILWWSSRSHCHQYFVQFWEHKSEVVDLSCHGMVAVNVMNIGHKKVAAPPIFVSARYFHPERLLK